jgi:lysophospholipase L1-like esterase
MAQIESWFAQDLTKPVKVHYIDGNVFSQDNDGNLVGVRVFADGEPATLSGTVAANVIRADGGTVAVSGTLSGNAVSVVLPAAAYAVPGIISIIIKLTDDETITTLCAAVANVYQSSTDTIIDPGTIIPSIQTLIDTVENVETQVEEVIESIPEDYTNLSNDVEQLKSAFNDPNVMDYTQSEIVTGYSVQSDGSITQGSGNVRDVIFPVTAGKTYTFFSPYLNRSGLVVNSTKSFSVGSTYTRASVTITGNYAEFTIPSGATWALFNFYTGSDYTETIASIKLYEQKYSELDVNIKVKPQNLPSNIVYEDENGFPPFFDLLSDSFKLTNIATTWNAGKILDSGGTVVDFSDEDYLVSDAIDISAYDYLYLSVSAYTGKLFYAFYTSDSAFITAQVATGASIDDFDGYIEVPQNAKYLKASGYDSINHNKGTIKYISGLQTANVKWKGKTWVCIGDSLTEENAATDKHYYNYVADETGITVATPINSYAKGGTGFANPNGTAGNFVTRMANIPTDADVYTIFGSFNDVAYGISNNIEIGEPSDSGTTTMCGYFNSALDAMFSRIPLANVGIVAPCPWQYCYPAGTGANSTYGKAYVEALEAVCKRRSIPFLNLFNFSGMRPWEEGFRTLVYTKDQAGGVHPNEIGHKILSTKFKSFLEYLLL